MSDSRQDPADDPAEPTELPTTTAGPSVPRSTEQIGPYRLLEKLGEGGMGEVWLAQQTEPVKATATTIRMRIVIPFGLGSSRQAVQGQAPLAGSRFPSQPVA